MPEKLRNTSNKNMGLDMYAHRKVYVKQWEHQKPDDRYSVAIRRGGKEVKGIDPDRISGVEEEVMYWRKANHIHAWFVKNVQNGKDDRGQYRVSAEKLYDLLVRCQKVIKASKLVKGTVYAGTAYDKDHPNGVVQRTPGKVIDNPAVAYELLPTQDGFFFGSTEYDEDYLDEVVRTRNWAADMLHDLETGVPGDIYYSSSW